VKIIAILAKARLLRAFRDSGVAWNCGDPLKSFAFGR
jgi:hypothetical protein